MAHLAQDLRHGMRALGRKPGYTIAAVLTLALGIGVNTAVFSVVYGVLLHPLPYAEPERVVTLWQTDARRPGEQDLVSPATFHEWQQRAADAFESFGAVSPFGLDYLSGDEPETVNTVLVSDGYFQSLGVTPLLGRVFEPRDHQRNNAQVLVITHGFWQQKFGGDPAVVGRSFNFNDQPHTVVGILPPEFRSPVYAGRGLYGPLAWWPGAEQQRYSFLGVVARLKRGVDLRRAQAALDAVSARIAEENPGAAQHAGAVAVPALDQIAGDVRPGLWTLFAAVGLILLIACANVATLQLARASERRREFAVRVALGANRGRLVVQLMTENFWLIVVAAAGGLLLAQGGLHLLRPLAPTGIPRLDQVTMNLPVMAFASGAALLTLLLFGLTPALQASRLDLQESLKEGSGGSSAGRGTNRLRNSLVVWEVALAVVLLVGAGLVTRSFVSLLRVNPGFRADNVVSLLVFVYLRNPTPQSQVTFFTQAIEKLQATPGVVAAGVASPQPFLLGSPASQPLVVDGAPAPPPGQEPSAFSSTIGGDYFRALQIPLLRGRTFTLHDAPDSKPVAVITETMATRLWPNEDPVGRTFTVQSAPPRQLEIVGVVGDVLHETLEEARRPAFYVPHTQQPNGGMSFVVRTVSDPAAHLPALKASIWSVNRWQPFNRIATMHELLERSLAQRRFLLYLLGGFAGLALLLAAVGIYGVISFIAARRTREIGLRIALGARPAQVMRLILRNGVGLTALGVAVGLLAAAALSRYLESQLFGISPLDPLAYMLTGGLLLAVAALASYLPARRAMRVDPIRVLRQE